MSDRQISLLTSRSLHHTLENSTLFEQKLFTARTKTEYSRKMELLNEFEKKKYPKILIEEPRVKEQESIIPKAAKIDATGVIRTGNHSTCDLYQPAF